MKTNKIFLFVLIMSMTFFSSKIIAQQWTSSGNNGMTTSSRVSVDSTGTLLSDRRMHISTSTDRFGLFVDNSTPNDFIVPTTNGLCFPGAEDLDEPIQDLIYGIYSVLNVPWGYAGYFEGRLGVCGRFSISNPENDENGGSDGSWYFTPSSSGLRIKGSGSNSMFWSHYPSSSAAYQQIHLANENNLAFAVDLGNTSSTRFSVQGNGKIKSWGGLTVYNNSAGAKPILLKQDGGDDLDRFYVAADGHVWTNKALTVEPATTGYIIEVEKSGNRKFSVRDDGHVYSNEGFKVSPDGSTGLDAFVVESSGSNDDPVFSIKKSGNLFAREIRVTQGEIPDYVFKDDYDLMPIEEVEAYVNEHKHLPNIPSEKEILAEGLNVGNQQMKQLEKIEELTLYLIEMNKRLNSLEKENLELKLKVESLSSTKISED